MPNRKTFDQRDKYDHSSRSVMRPEKNDLKADVAESDTPVPNSGRSKSAGNAPRRGQRR